MCVVRDVSLHSISSVSDWDNEVPMHCPAWFGSTTSGLCEAEPLELITELIPGSKLGNRCILTESRLHRATLSCSATFPESYVQHDTRRLITSTERNAPGSWTHNGLSLRDGNVRQATTFIIRFDVGVTVASEVPPDFTEAKF